MADNLSLSQYHSLICRNFVSPTSDNNKLDLANPAVNKRAGLLREIEARKDMLRLQRELDSFS